MTTKSNELVVFATARAVPGKEAALVKALQEASAPTLAQPGCLGFSLYGTADGSTITAIERWKSKSDHQKHLQGKHVQELMGKFNGVLAGAPVIVEMNPL